MQNRILIIRFGSLGDVILSSATIVNLRLAYPGHTLTYLTKARFRTVVELMPGVDELVTVSDHAGPAEMFSSMLELDRRSFDIIVDLHGNNRSWLARSMVTANQKVVYPKERLTRWQMTRRHKTLPDQYRTTIELYNDCLTQLGQLSPCQRPQLKPPLLTDEYPVPPGQGGARVVIAPGAAHPNKAWPLERFVEVANLLNQSVTAQIVWAISSADKATLSEADLPNDSSSWLLVDCPLEQLAAIIARSDLVLANDSGVAHLASAVGTPVLAVFGPTHPALGFEPRGLRDKICHVDEACRPCSRHGQKACWREERYCFTKISAHDVHTLATSMLTDSADLQPALFVDRDGTIIVNKHYLGDPDGVELIDGAAGALAKAAEAGYKIVIVSNQSGVARGYHTVDDVENVNGRLLELLAAEHVTVDGVYYCPHYPVGAEAAESSDRCECRKPSPRMAEAAAHDLGLDLHRSIVVGDSLADIGLGQVIGGRSILVRTGFGTEIEQQHHQALASQAVSIVDDLGQAVELLS
jgi:histidinol-phosphate phosphatase family protein